MERPRVPAVMLGASVAYLALVGGLMIASGVAPTPDFLAVVLSPALLLAGRLRAWLHDWAPFVVLLLLWDGARGLAYTLALTSVHSGGLRPDLALGGGRLPTQELQSLAAAAGIAPAADVVATAIDLAHFPSLFALALLIWLVRRSEFGVYVQAVFATAIVALLVFVVAPTAPPWYAAEQGFGPAIRHPMVDVVPVTWMGWYQAIDPNPVAALPSLHAALPTVATLALWRLRSRLFWPVLAWTFVMWVSLVYLGEHYVTDVVAGAALAGAAWFAVEWIHARRGAHRPAATSASEPARSPRPATAAPTRR